MRVVRVPAAWLGVAALVAATAAAPLPALAQATKSLGGGQPGAKPAGKLLSRDELRACMAQQKTLADGRDTLDRENADLEREKAGLMAAGQALNDERTTLERQRDEAVAAYNQRMAAREAKVADMNRRDQALAQLSTQRASRGEFERGRAELERDIADLRSLDATLNADAESLRRQQTEAAATHNARAQDNDRKVDAWNGRQRALAERADALQADKQRWTAACAERRYREDDEIAIKAGK